jgi:hypothetical protein
MIDSSYGVGYTLGPVMGAFLFWLGGYEFVLAGFGAMLAVSCFAISFLLPNFIDKNTDMDTNQDEEEESLLPDFSKWSLLYRPNFLFPLLTVGMSYFSWEYMTPVVSLYLVDQFQME